MFDRFLIAPLNAGWQKDVRPWRIMDDAFERMENVYCWRERVRKRFGTLWMGSTQFQTRFRLDTGLNTDGAGNAAGNIRTQTGDATLPLNVGQAFSVGGAMYTVVSSTPGVQPMLATQGAGTFNITNGDFTITGGPINTDIFFYPAFPIMGLTQFLVGDINNHPSFGFDTRYAYKFTQGAGWNRVGAGSSLIWHGGNLNYFWAANWKGVTANLTALFVTNFNATIGAPGVNDDPLWVTQDNPAGNVWTIYTPYFAPGGGAPMTGPFVQTARIIVAFRNRIVLLNTIEQTSGTNEQFKNRARYSINGSPFVTNAWYEPNQSDNAATANSNYAGAGFIDATTGEAIVSVGFIKDRLIVYFERSTWELAYTGNEVTPFIWQKLNTELGSQALLSSIPFDTEVFTVGNTGIYACNGSNVARIDERIPNFVFDLNIENNKAARIAGIRDYKFELVYWSVCSDDSLLSQVFTNKVLLYNYKNRTWAINDDCFTVYGFCEQISGPTWASSAPLQWFQAVTTWASNISTNERVILAGTPEGYVLVIDPDITLNAPSMQITNIFVNASLQTQLVIINHNFSDADFLYIENAEGVVGLNNNVYTVFVIDSDNVVIFDANNVAPFTGVYIGGGTARRVSQIRFLTKQFNPYDKHDRDVYIQKVDFAVEATAFGQITVDYFPSATTLSMIAQGQASGAIVGNNILETTPYDPVFYPLEQYQTRLWHPVYFQTYGECIQLVIYLDNEQMFVPNIAFEDFQLEAMTLYTQPTSQRME